MIPSILIIEDDITFSTMLKTWLEKKGFKTTATSTCAKAKKLLISQNFDLILSDLRLPDQDGIHLLTWLRKQLYETPYIIMTNYADIQTAVQAIKQGANDYIAKPIKLQILMSRIQAILKRIETEPESSIRIDRERHEVIADKRTFTLPRKEFALLDLLFSSPGKLFTREEIYSNIWGDEVVVGERTIDVHIRKLRQKIGEKHIITIKGVGYKFVK